MACCGSTKPNLTGKKALDELKAIDKLKNDYQINDIRLTFDERKGEWKSK